MNANEQTASKFPTKDLIFLTFRWRARKGKDIDQKTGKKVTRVMAMSFLDNTPENVLLVEEYLSLSLKKSKAYDRYQKARNNADIKPSTLKRYKTLLANAEATAQKFIESLDNQRYRDEKFSIIIDGATYGKLEQSKTAEQRTQAYQDHFSECFNRFARFLNKFELEEEDAEVISNLLDQQTAYAQPAKQFITEALLHFRGKSVKLDTSVSPSGIKFAYGAENHLATKAKFFDLV